ncbi:MAG: sel1 repeat family protein [Bacteroidetes bacterium]|nr:sel1 repeat family protein [Bacteroidota bacterium]
MFAQQQKKSAVYKEPYRFTGLPLILYSAYDAQVVELFTLIQEANAGKALAQHDLGIRYLLGKGLPADTTKAVYWLMRAAENKLPLAHYNLGILHLHGIGVPWNPFDAYKHFQYAAEEEIPEALFAMGILTSENFIVPRNWPKTFQYIKRAAELGYEDAHEALKELRYRGIDSIETNQQHSRQKKTQSSSLSSGTLLFLDFSSTDTTTIPPDTLLQREAYRELSSIQKKFSQPLRTDSTFVKLFELAELGVPEAVTYIGRIYEKGYGQERSLIKAALLYFRAIRLESLRAPSLLWNLIHTQEFTNEFEHLTRIQEPYALMLWAGLTALRFSTLLNEQQAFTILQQAANSNCTPAMTELGLCYYTGRWTKQDKNNAAYWFKNASDRGDHDARIRYAVMVLSNEVSNGMSIDSALHYLNTMTERGSLLARNALALCYERGYTVMQNKGEAYRLYRQALARGSETAYRSLIRMHNEIRPNDPDFQINE